MAYTKEYYQQKLGDLQRKSQANLQKFISYAFEMVSEAKDIEERIREIQELLKEEPKEEKKSK